jgi:predicted PurR-regulated permease PerM
LDLKIKWDPLYLKYTFYASLTIIIAIVLYHAIDNLSIFVGSIRTALHWTRRLLSPFIIAAFIAYLLNPGVRWFETRVYNRLTTIRRRRNLSILSVYLILGGAITTLTIIIAPQVADNVREIAMNAPDYVTFVETFIQARADEISNIRFYNADLYTYVEPLEQTLTDFINRAGEFTELAVNMVVNRVFRITSSLFNFILGLVISFYALADKESFKKGFERFLRAVFSDDKVEGIKQFGREADLVFSKFIVGKSLDSLIIGILCYIGMNILNIRYALLLSVFVGVTNMIPYFGPIIGMIPAGLLTVFDSPVRALWVIIFLLALQQFDGLILGPKILGSSVGMPPFWVIFAIIIGGKLFGVLGMFLGVPVFGVIRLLVTRILDRLVAQKEALVPYILEEEEL